MKESDLEAKCRAYVEEAYYGKLLKFVSPAEDGWPDRILLVSGMAPVFIEFKQPGESLTPLQDQRRRWLLLRGFRHWIVRYFDDFVRRLKEPA